MTNFSERIIIISDLHLGAIGRYSKKLKIFLQKIIDNQCRNVKHLILAVDFLDLMISVLNKLITQCKDALYFCYQLQVKYFQSKILNNRSVLLYNIPNNILEDLK